MPNQSQRVRAEFWELTPETQGKLECPSSPDLFVFFRRCRLLASEVITRCPGRQGGLMEKPAKHTRAWFSIFIYPNSSRFGSFAERHGDKATILNGSG